VLLGFGIVVIVGILGVAAALAYTAFKFGSIDRVDVDLAGTSANEPSNYLIVGSDTRELDPDTADAGGIFGGLSAAELGGQRADTIVVARVNPANSSVRLLSVPRDLWVESSATGDETRINSTYNNGPQDLINTVETELGIPIHHYAEVNFDGFKGLVDVVGGVPMYFDRPMYDEQTGLSIAEEGCYLLDPIEALAFARSRQLFYSNGVRWVPDSSADLGRITRQQVFLRRALQQVSGLGIGDVNTMRRLVDVGVGSVRLDDQLGVSEMLALGKQFSDFDPEGMQTFHLPTEVTRTEGGASVLMLEPEAEDVLEVFQGNAADLDAADAVAPTTTIPNASITVDVLNGTEQSGLATTTADTLVAALFQVGEIGNAEPAAATVVLHGPGSAALADTVARHVTPTPEIESDPTLAPGTVRLVVGSDFVKIDTRGGSGSGSGSTTGGDARTEALDGAQEPVGFATGEPPPGVECTAQNAIT
jgi:LCP family protein required for cell wall assembly